jgi:DNA-binding response OmpR family regulator
MADQPDPRPAVLIVESEAVIAMLLEDLLAEAGHRTLWVPDAARAIAAAGDGASFTAAVVDLRLHDGTDGRDILRRLRRRWPSLPVVMVTGFDARAPQAQMRGLGGPTARLSMPFEWQELTVLLADLLDRRAASSRACRRGQYAA